MSTSYDLKSSIYIVIILTASNDIMFKRDYEGSSWLKNMEVLHKI